MKIVINKSFFLCNRKLLFVLKFAHIIPKSFNQSQQRVANGLNLSRKFHFQSWLKIKSERRAMWTEWVEISRPTDSQHGSHSLRVSLAGEMRSQSCNSWRSRGGRKIYNNQRLSFLRPNFSLFPFPKKRSCDKNRINLWIWAEICKKTENFPMFYSFPSSIASRIWNLCQTIFTGKGKTFLVFIILLSISTLVKISFFFGLHFFL